MAHGKREQSVKRQRDRVQEPSALSRIGHLEQMVSGLKADTHGFGDALSRVVKKLAERDGAIAAGNGHGRLALADEPNQAKQPHRVPPPPQPGRPLGPVQESLVRMENRVIELHQVIARLEERLEPVLGSAPPSTANDSAAATERFAVSNSVHRYCDAIGAAENRLQTLLERLEL